MIKNEKGITLSSLMITVVVMIILTGVGIGSVYTGINDFIDNRLEIELGIVRQAVIEQYQKAKAVNKLEILISDDDIVQFWVGERLENIPESENNVLKYESSLNYQEDYYYRLNKENLDKLGLQDSKYTYIVNYKTGEVYNETKGKNSQGQVLYLPAINYGKENTEDTTNFNDWNE